MLHKMLRQKLLCLFSLGQQRGSTTADCDYYQMHFFGKDFPEEFREAPNGFILRAKLNQDPLDLIDELKNALIANVKGSNFKSAIDFPTGKVDADMEQPHFYLVMLTKLTEEIRQVFGKGDPENGARLLAKKLDPSTDDKGSGSSNAAKYFFS